MAEQQEQGFSFKLVSRVASYSAVSTLFETGKDYYYWGKENSKVVAFAESSLEGGLSWLKPKFETALQSQTYKSLQPLLSKADNLGVAALDTVETRAQSIKTNYDVLGERVSKVKTATYDAIENAQKKYVAPVDEYLNTSLVARPYTIALGVTEKVVDRFLPPSDQLDEDEKSGPIARTTLLSKRVQQQAFAKLHNLSFRPPEKLRSMEQHTVDLIKYAAQTLDGAVAGGAHLVSEGPKEVRAKVASATHSAVTALNSAVDVLVSHLPPKFKELKDSAAEAKVEPGALFSTVAQSGSKLLNDVSATLQSYASKGEAAPAQLIANTLGSVRKVLGSLLSFAPQAEKKEPASSDGPADIVGSN